MRKLHLTYLVLIVAAAVLAVTLSGRTPPPPDAGTKKTDKQAGASTKRKPRRPLIRLAGTVLDATAKPVKGATVFVLSKKKRGAERDDVPHEVTDAEGRWSLRTRETVGRWIGVVAPGYRNAWLDGDGVDPQFQIPLVIKRAPPLEVELKDAAGKPLAGHGVQLEPWPPAEFHFLPGPSGRRDGQWQVTDARGVARFFLGGAGPVRIAPEIPGHHTHPRSTWMADARGLVRLEVHRSSSLRVLLTKADSGEKLKGLVTVELFDPASGRSLGSYSDTIQEPGVWHLEHEIVPGTYDVHVTCAERDTVIVPGFVVTEDPDVAVLAVATEPRKKPGRLRLRLEGVGGTRATRGRRRAPLVYFLREAEGWLRLGWRTGAPEVWDRKKRRLEFLLAPGRYRMLVADVLTGRAALLPDLLIEEGAERDLTVPLRPGIRPTLPPLCAEGAYPRQLRVLTSDGARLPVYGSTPNGRARMGDELDVISCQWGGESVRLGPYPVPEITLEVLEWSDAVRTHTLR